MNRELEKLRDKIDEIDLQLLELLGKRAQHAAKTRLYKQKSKLITDGVDDPAREQRVIMHLLKANQSLLPDSAITHIFQTIIDECRALQKQEDLKSS